MHTIEGFERDILPRLKHTLVSMRFGGACGFSGDANEIGGSVCLLGALRTVNRSNTLLRFTEDQRRRLEQGFEGFDRTGHLQEPDAALAADPYYKLGKAIAYKHAANRPLK